MSHFSTTADACETIRWRAVQQRDKSFHSAFIYAVLTTRIFCRPTCPARLARRANVVFFDSAIDAASTGFRPCKRCRPTQQDFDSDIHGVARTVDLACEYIKTKEGNVSVGEVAEHVGFSVRHLYGLFKRAFECSPAAYASCVKEDCRRREAGRQLRTDTGHELEMLSAHSIDYSCPFTYAGMEDWTWDIEDGLVKLSESCDSTESQGLLTPVFGGFPSSNDWEKYPQSETCGFDETMFIAQTTDLLASDWSQILGTEGTPT